MSADATHPAPDPDRTRTTRGESVTSGGQRRSGILWVYPEYGRVSAPAAAVELGRGAEGAGWLPGDEISRYHARLTAVGPGYSLVDLNSRNGSFVGGRRIDAATIVGPGDVLRLGEWVGVVVDALPDSPRFEALAPGLLGGPTLAAALDAARGLAPRLGAIVIEGETGTGKECVARALHRWSGRAGAYVAVDCPSVPEQLAEAELFGHRRGAFSGAEVARLGCLRQADRGTVLLDEFLELPEAVQAKLLRTLQERSVKPVGEDRSEPVDLLVLAALQSDLQAAVLQGRVRRDLAERLGGLTVRLPPLRGRREDIVPLAQHFLAAEAQALGLPTPAVDAALAERLSLGAFAGNVRQLATLVKRMVLEHGQAARLGLRHLPVEGAEGLPGTGEGPLGPSEQAEVGVPGVGAAAGPTMAGAGAGAGATGAAPMDAGRGAAAHFRQGSRERERGALLQALQANGGVVAQAARALGISRQKAYRLLRDDGE